MMEITDFSLDLFSLSARRALVTGGNTGLGRAFTLALARAGTDLFVASIAEDDGTTEKLVRSVTARSSRPPSRP